MQISDLPFGTTDWSNVPAERRPGETGWAEWRVRQFGPIRVRMLQYSPGYRSDHWCSKGHILLCLEGELVTELQDGRKFVLRPGVSLGELVSGLNALGVTPQDLIAILQAIQTSGALQADVEVM